MSKRRHEGYVLIDHRDSPGVPDALILAARRAGKDVPLARPGTTYESATLTCSHCQMGIILNPDRSRERHYCPQCDHYVCDVCAEIRRYVGCRTMNAKLERLQERIARGVEPLIQVVAH